MVAIGTRWRLEVVATQPNVSQEYLGLGRQPLLPPGTENYLVRVKLRYVGRKPDKVLTAIDAIDAGGIHHGYYSADVQCNPPDKLNFPARGLATIRFGKSTVGTLCFLIASRDAATLELYAYPPDAPGFRPPTQRVWFSLR